MQMLETRLPLWGCHSRQKKTAALQLEQNENNNRKNEAHHVKPAFQFCKAHVHQNQL
jgi:hypothetical protein